MALFDVGGFFEPPCHKFLYTVRGKKIHIDTNKNTLTLLSSAVLTHVHVYTPHTKTQTVTADETRTSLTASAHWNYAVKSCMSVHLWIAPDCIFAQQTWEKITTTSHCCSYLYIFTEWNRDSVSCSIPDDLCPIWAAHQIIWSLVTWCQMQSSGHVRLSRFLQKQLSTQLSSDLCLLSHCEWELEVRAGVDANGCLS